jgi:O-antigen/teichoic acid export membrane protein
VNGLRQKTVRALQWSYLSALTNVLLAPVFAAILARLLTREDFGLFAFGMSLYAVGLFIADFGIGQALVQKHHLTEEDIRAGFTSSLGLGLLASALVWLAAPLAVHVLDHPEVVRFVRFFACLYPLAALATVSTSLLRRALNFKPLMIGDVGAYVIGQGVFGLGAAYLGLGAFSLIISVAVQYLIQLGVSYTYGRHPFRLTFRPEPYRALYAFGGRVSLVSFLEFASVNLDTWMIGRFYGAAALGVYNRGYNAVYAPLISLARSLTRVLAPSFSAVQHEQAKLRRAYLTGLLAVSVVLFSVAAGVFVCAREIVLVLLGERFAGAIPIVQLLAVFIPFPVLANLSAVLAEATARLNTKIAIQASYLLLLAAAYVGVYRLGGGIVDFAGVLVVAGALRSVAYALVARNILGGGGREIARAYAVGLGCAVTVGGVLFALVAPLRGVVSSPFVLFGIELGLGGVLLAAVILLGPATEVQVQARALLARLWPRLRRRWRVFAHSEKRT